MILDPRVAGDLSLTFVANPWKFEEILYEADDLETI
jgi:hypothetical protein